MLDTPKSKRRRVADEDENDSDSFVFTTTPYAQQHRSSNNPQPRVRDYDNVQLPVQDTPRIERNAAMRSNASRRTSLEKRGRRASSLGNGYLATPHPQVPDLVLYRHIDPCLDQYARLRKLIAIAIRRALECIHDNSTLIDSRILPLFHQCAQQLVDSISDTSFTLPSLSLSSSSSSTNTAATTTAKTKLPKHPQNAVNEKKEAQLKHWRDLIREEDNIRISLLRQYKTIFNDENALLSSTSSEQDVGPPNIHNLSSLDDVIAFGRSHRSTTTASSTNTPSPISHPLPSPAQDNHKHQINFNNLPLQASSIRQSTYRLDRLVHLADSLAHKQLEQSHRALDILTLDAYRPFSSTFIDPAAASSTSSDSSNTLFKFSSFSSPSATSLQTTRNSTNLLRAIAKSGNPRF